MEASTLFVAQILAVCYLSIGIGFLVSKDYYKKEVIKLPESPGFILLSGYLAIIFGMAILYVQSVWNSEWTTLITIVGWVASVKGILLIVFPRHMTKYRVLFQTKYYNWVGITIIALGLVLGYFGFFA
jgi:uncharacterized membrane protein